MRFRNIWYRELPPRAVEGGTDGPLTTEATMAKRHELAASIREDSEKLKDPANPGRELLRLMESLEYEKTEPTQQRVEQLAGQYIEGLKAMSADQAGSKKDQAKNVRNAFQFLARFKILPADFGPKVELEKFIKEQNWDKKSGS